MRRLLVIVCLLAGLMGCERREAAATEPVRAVVTNMVEIVREIAVTNTVTVTITNTVVAHVEPTRILSARKTSPYAVASSVLDAARLRKLLSDSGARVVDCSNGATALIEARDETVGMLRAGGVVSVLPLSAAEKVASDAGESVRVVPLSSIDVESVTRAIRALGGEVVQVVTVGKPAVRAKLSLASVRKLAERGDVRRIERDAK